MRGEIGVEIHNSAETRGRVEETSRSKIQARGVELGVERSERGVLLIDGTECSVEFELAAAGQIRGDGNGKFGGDGNIGCRDVHVVIGTCLLRIRGAYDDPSVAQREFLDGYFSSVCCAAVMRAKTTTCPTPTGSSTSTCGARPSQFVAPT